MTLDENRRTSPFKGDLLLCRRQRREKGAGTEVNRDRDRKVNNNTQRQTLCEVQLSLAPNLRVLRHWSGGLRGASYSRPSQTFRVKGQVAQADRVKGDRAHKFSNVNSHGRHIRGVLQ